MRKTVLLVFALLICRLSFAQDSYEYTKSLALIKSYYNNRQYDSIYGMCSDRIKGMLPEEKLAQSFSGLYNQLGEISSFEDMSDTKTVIHNFKTVFNKGLLTLMISVNAEHKFDALRFVPYMEPKTDKPESNFVLNTPGCNIYGTLTVPEGGRKPPVVLIIAGSGPTDRDGNSHLGVNADTYKMIADSLKQAGIACLRYDKRGIGESRDTSQSESGLRFDDYVDDAVQIISKLKKDDRFLKVVIVGHSEGSLIAMVAASREAVSAVVSLAGAGERADKVLKDQFAQGDPQKAAYAGLLLDSLVAGHRVTNTEPGLESMFRNDIQPYLISWLRYDPQTVIAKLKMPVAIVQGTADIQVSYTEAEFLKKAKPDARIVAVKGMNHVLKQVGESATREENIATYTNNKLPVCHDVIQEIIRATK